MRKDDLMSDWRPQDEGYDATARLIMMDDPKVSLLDFTRRITEEHPTITMHLVMDLNDRWRGSNGRQPTHDYVSGNRLTRGFAFR